MPRSLTWLATVMVALALTAACAPAGRTATRSHPAISARTRALAGEAESHELARRHGQARQAYAAAKRDAPDDASRAFAAREYASTLIAWGEYDEAERELGMVVKLTPDDASAWHDLGILRHKRGDSTGADAALRRAAQAAPDDPRPLIALAALQVTQKQFEQAMVTYRQVLHLELPPRTRAAVERALALLRHELRDNPGAEPD